MPASPSTSASRRSRWVISPLGSPTVKAFRSMELVRSGVPGSYIPAPSVTTQPTTRDQPSTSAIASSLMLFWADTTNPPGARWGSMNLDAQLVSYDLTDRNTTSNLVLAADTSPR